MKLGVQLSLEKGLAVDDYKTIFDRWVLFDPYSFTKDTKTEPWDKKRFLLALSKYKSDVFLAVSDRLGNVFSLGMTGTKNPHFSLEIEQDEALYKFEGNDVEEVIGNANFFTSAYLYNVEYTQVQSAVNESSLMGKHFSKEIISTLADTPFTLDYMNRKKYNVRSNPGRKVLSGYTWLNAAYKMWFGNGFFKLVPKERILSFPHAVEIKELPTGIVFVQLYDDIHLPYTSESRDRQQKWVEWIDMNSVVDKYS